MSGWQIDPAGVRTVFSEVQTGADALETGASPDRLGGVPDALVWGGEFTAAVSAAVDTAVGPQAPRVGAVMSHVGAGVQGVTNSTVCYLNADVEMAAQAQAEAARAAASGDFSWFEQNGVR